ncbi:queuosine precursor transporter [Xenorhabdus bovienii]|uniref:queuosine precursor transporter n=1 Tax=Xenorhabdus bovienii TaxID=40576 RepID=UPI00237D0ED7|nr:queuosine precursor transporter [Xenorhabdus bovienii]MDE1482072.1 queuosine precursor transporter [Xenorhabdus bovienii]MDE9430519.1 queuosine precursor transporter [Xenorhabdus bovienii]MDE9433531.1 queuosine precursor transporter [Xenorhabdus bovienii]MDE9435481.1 queuosine precursor transporter [Xenorhabdus bovienii]MDE9442999.1 queuosine precursor transporter [Xenorhabdus bovienii]
MSGNQKYKLLGFSRSSDAIRANIMILSTGKSISIPLQELESSQVSEDLNRHELKEIYRRIYGGADTVTAYDLTDRHERSWFAYLVIAFSLAVIYIFCTITGIKPVSIPSINMVIPSAIFFYPLTFILVDILNEFYGLRLARKAILFSFIANILFVLGLIFTAALPGLKEWELEGAYTEIVHSIAAVLVASSIAYIVSENVNSWLLCKIKELTNSRYLFIRVITSTTVAAALDSIIFCTLAFYNTLDADTIKSIIFSQFIIKLAYAIVGVGPIYGTRALFRKYINA